MAGQQLTGTGTALLPLNSIQIHSDINNNADIAVASSVLLLVPSFPLINSFSDILKGYVNIGIGRAVFTYMLTLSACVGIVMALVLLQIQHWGF